MGDSHCVTEPVGLSVGVNDRGNQAVQDLHVLLFLPDSWDDVDNHVEEIRCDQACQQVSNDVFEGLRLEEHHDLGPLGEHVFSDWELYLDRAKADKGQGRPSK
ncbi:hypothetical protein D3C85_1097030 [compost metagenome]